MGELSDAFAGFSLKPDKLKALCARKITVDDLTENDFTFKVEQKGVDMRIGIDIASVTFKKQVDKKAG